VIGQTEGMAAEPAGILNSAGGNDADTAGSDDDEEPTQSLPDYLRQELTLRSPLTRFACHGWTSHASSGLFS
jgi:hypothetical protein